MNKEKRTYTLLLLNSNFLTPWIFVLSFFSLTIHAHRCTQDFLFETHSRNLTLCKRYKHRNGVEFGWKVENTTANILKVRVVF
uniref:Uncharacterized protein n=1 Tax=Solanum lycopersicum TaxID=4081 RepID=A0A3Q7I1M2_SOLLC